MIWKHPKVDIFNTAACVTVALKDNDERNFFQWPDLLVVDFICQTR
jgi:hypothetical protein